MNDLSNTAATVKRTGETKNTLAGAETGSIGGTATATGSIGRTATATGSIGGTATATGSIGGTATATATATATIAGKEGMEGVNNPF